MGDRGDNGLWGRAERLLSNAEALTQVIQSRREHSKLRYDRYKHQTTLATGGILIISALLGSTFRDASCLSLVIASVALLLISAVLGFLAMGLITEALGSEDLMFLALGEHNDRERYQQMDDRMERFETAAKWVAWASVVFLVLGLLSFAWFAMQILPG